MASDLISKINYATVELGTTCGLLKKAGIEKAQTEAAYRQELAKLMLEYRTEGMPVTIIHDVCRGNAKIAKLKLNRDIADSTYQSLLESINVQKLTIRILENQIQREWTTPRGGI